MKKAQSLSALSRFRAGLYACLPRRADSLFELCDAMLCADSPVTSLPELTLLAEHQRGHGAMYDALNHGRLDISRLRWSLAALPLPRAADGRIVPAVDVSPRLRPDAPTSPDRLFCHIHGRAKNQAQLIPGWPYSFVAALENGCTSWTQVLDAIRLGLADDDTALTRDPAARGGGPHHHRRAPSDARASTEGCSLWPIQTAGTSLTRPPPLTPPATAPPWRWLGSGCTPACPTGAPGWSTRVSSRSWRAPWCAYRSNACPARATPNRCGRGPRPPKWTPSMWIGSGRRSFAGSTWSTPSACSSRLWLDLPEGPLARGGRSVDVVGDRRAHPAATGPPAR